MLTAFSVVLGTLVIQGLTLKPLLRALDLHDDDPVGRELTCGARTRAACRTRELRGRPIAGRGRRPAGIHGASGIRTTRMPTQATPRAPRTANIHRGALQAARQAVLAMRANDEIGDDAFHRIEEELDWLEMADVRNVPSV